MEKINYVMRAEDFNPILEKLNDIDRNLDYLNTQISYIRKYGSEKKTESTVLNDILIEIRNLADAIKQYHDSMAFVLSVKALEKDTLQKLNQYLKNWL